MRRIIRVPWRGLLAYIMLTILLILPALNIGVPWLIQKELGRKFDAEIIIFNPLTLAIDIRNASLYNQDDSLFLNWKTVTVNLSVESLWKPGLVFDAFIVDSLHAVINKSADGSFNFSDLIADEPNDKSTEDNEGLPKLTVHHFSFNSKRIEVIDHSRKPVFTTHWDGLSIAVNDLSTVFEPERPYSLYAVDEAGGELHWEGEISIPGAHSQGEISLTHISLRPFWRFVEPWVNFELMEGQLELSAHYEVNWGDALSYDISRGAVSVHDISVVAKDTTALPNTHFALGNLGIAEIKLNSAQQHVDIGELSLEQLDLAGWSEGEKTSLAELFATTMENSSAPNEPSLQPSESPPPWSITINTAYLHSGSIRWRSEFTNPPLMELSAINIDVNQLSWPPQGNTGLSASLAINNEASLKSAGQINLHNGDGQFEYFLENLPLKWFGPNLPQELNANIGSGYAHAQGKVTLVEFGPATLTANGAVTDFSMVVKKAENALTTWKSVRWTELEVNLLQKSLTLAQLQLDTFSGRLHIFEDGSINAQRLFKDTEDTDTAAVQDDTAPWQIAIPSIIVTDSKLDFKDASLPIHFRTIIGDLNGEVRNISTSSDTPLQVNLKGSVDGYAPVILEGTALPFGEQADLDITLSFEGVDLARLTPYSGTYAGYAINQGILNMRLEYKLKESRLNGENNIVIDQLRLGDKVDSDKAVDIPLGLAIALLTDIDGVINLDVPVSGDVNDPDFAIGSIVFKALLNIITKAITAPFTFLASLIGSEEDLQRINFSAGSPLLDEASQQKLLELAQALTQRPELVLSIAGRINPVSDREKLAQKILIAELQNQGLTEEAIQARDEDWQAAISTRYRDQQVKTDRDTEVTLLEQYQVVVENIEVSDTQLENLINERAVVVKTFLVVDAKLPASRAVIEKSQLNAQENNFSGVELNLGS